MTTLSQRLITLVFVAVWAAGCQTTNPPVDRQRAPIAGALEHRSPDIRIGLVGALREGDEGTLVEDPGWVEYVLAIENPGDAILMVNNLKLLTRGGRYLDSAASFEQVTSPPDAASEIASGVATRAAGIAAGQAIPYGGTIVSIIAGAVSASSAESNLGDKRDFDLRKLKAVELAPGAKVTGSAFLPNVTDEKALIVEYDPGGGLKRIEMPFPRP